MTKIIAVAGKGGVGKTTTIALLVDELARFGYTGRLLVIDADPAMTLHMALGVPENASSVSKVRDASKLDARTIRSLPAGMTPAAYVKQRLQDFNVLGHRKIRDMKFDMMTMGWSEGTGCYCSINNTLSMVLEQIRSDYDLVIIDNEAGLEHLSRYRIKHIDLLLTVAELYNPASLAVAGRIEEVTQSAGVVLDETWTLYRTMQEVGGSNGGLYIPNDGSMHQLMLDKQPVVKLSLHSPLRRTLQILVARVLELGEPSTRQAPKKAETDSLILTQLMGAVG